MVGPPGLRRSILGLPHACPACPAVDAHPSSRHARSLCSPPLRPVPKRTRPTYTQSKPRGLSFRLVHKSWAGQEGIPSGRTRDQGRTTAAQRPLLSCRLSPLHWPKSNRGDRTPIELLLEGVCGRTIELRRLCNRFRPLAAWQRRQNYVAFVGEILSRSLIRRYDCSAIPAARRQCLSWPR